MTAPALPADAWVPVPLRWRHVLPGDVIAGRDGLLYVERVMPDDRGRTVLQVMGAAGTWRGDVDPDEPVTVLMRADERDAATLLRDQLGARLIERRTT